MAGLTKVRNTNFKSLDNGLPINIVDEGADPTGVLDSTVIIQAALDNNKMLYVPKGKFRINGTLTFNQGNSMFSDSPIGYDGWDLANNGEAPYFFKDSAGSNGSIIKIRTSNGLSGITFSGTKSGGFTDGIIQIMPDVITRYCNIKDIHIEGSKTGDVTGSTTCYGIKLPARTSTNVTYFNKFSNITVHNCDVCFFLGNQVNANNFNNIITKESHIHYELDGTGGEVLENNFTNLGLFSISGSISPLPIGFKRTNSKLNNFIGFATEMFGVLHSNGGGNSGDKFIGTSNEVQQSVAEGGTDYNYMLPENVSNQFSMPLIAGTGGGRYLNGSAITWKKQLNITGAVQYGLISGTLTASNDSSRAIIRMPSSFTKTGRVSYFGKLKLFISAPFGNGTDMAEIDFSYRMNNTGSGNADFTIHKVIQVGANITGVYFLTGVASGLTQGIAVVCGSGGIGANNSNYIRATLDVDASMHDFNLIGFENIRDLSSTTSTAITANDVTDGIDMLTLATTAV